MKGNIFVVCAIKAYRGRSGIPPLILNLSSEWSVLRPSRRTTEKNPPGV